MSIQTVFSGAGGGQVFLYEAYSAGTYVDTMGVASDFNQPNVGNRPTANTSIAPSGATMLSFDGDDMVGDFGTGGIVDDADMPAWSGIFVEHFILYFTSTPNNVDEMRLIDQGSGSWGRNQFGAGIIYRADALSDAAMSVSTPYFVTIEHNAATAVSTMTVDGVVQSDTGGNWDGVRDDFMGYKLIGAQGDLSKGFTGCFGCYGLGHATTWGSTERAALFAAMDEWWSGGGGGGGYDLDADAESFALTGVAAGLTAQRKVDAVAGSYALTGQNAGLAKGYALAATTGSYVVAGIAAGLVATRTIGSEAGSLALAGNDAGLAVARSLSCVSGSFALAGSSTDLAAHRAVAADVVAFVATGQSVGLVAARVLAPAAGAVALTGNDAGLVYEPIGGYEMSADAGVFALASNSVALTRAAGLSAETGAVSVTGQDAPLAHGRYLTAESRTFALSGEDAGLAWTRTLVASAGSFVLTGIDVGFLGLDVPALPPGISTVEPFAVVASVRMFPSSGQVVVERSDGTIKLGVSS